MPHLLTDVRDGPAAAWHRRSDPDRGQGRSRAPGSAAAWLCTVRPSSSAKTGLLSNIWSSWRILNKLWPLASKKSNVELELCGKLPPVINKHHPSPQQCNTTHHAFGDCGCNRNCWVGLVFFFFSTYMNWSIYLFCVTAKDPVRGVDPCLWLGRMQCSLVSWTHPIRVMRKTATERRANVAEEAWLVVVVLKIGVLALRKGARLGGFRHWAGGGAEPRNI